MRLAGKKLKQPAPAVEMGTRTTHARHNPNAANYSFRKNCRDLGSRRGSPLESQRASRVAIRYRQAGVFRARSAVKGRGYCARAICIGARYELRLEASP